MTTLCPDCGDWMSLKRLSPRALAVTGGVCAPCAPTAHRLAQRAIEAERALATFGTGRTAERAPTARMVAAENTGPLVSAR